MKFTPALFYKSIILFKMAVITFLICVPANAKCQINSKLVNPSKKSLINKITERKVDSVLALMHLNEKIGQLVQYSGMPLVHHHLKVININ